CKQTSFQAMSRRDFEILFAEAWINQKVNALTIPVKNFFPFTQGTYQVSSSPREGGAKFLLPNSLSASHQRFGLANISFLPKSLCAKNGRSPRANMARLSSEPCLIGGRPGCP